MSTTEADKSERKQRTYRFEKPLIEDLALMETMTGRDKTKLIHEAVRLYRASSEFRALVEQHRREMDEAVAAFSTTAPNQTSVATGRAKKIRDKLRHKTDVSK